MNIITACNITFIACCFIHEIGILAARILKQLVGVSLYVKVNSPSDRAGKQENLSFTALR